MSLPRYAAYKDSGSEWLGQVPAHWSCTRIGALFSEVNDPGNDDLPVLSVSIHDGVSDRELGEEELDRKITRSEDRSKYKAVAPGDLTYNMMRAWQGGFGSVLVAGQVSPAYVVARPRGGIVTSHIESLLRTPAAVTEMKRHSRGVTDFRLRLYWEDFKAIRLAIPPASEQRAIAAFVATEAANIDALIAEQEQLIALLAEKRQATISHAVTRGLDPDVPMKDSGVPWLGRVPAHWGVCDFRRVVTRIEQGWSPECFARPAEGSEWGVLKAGCVNSGVFNPTENKALPDELDPVAELVVRDGDLLMSRASGSPKLVGSTAVVSNAPERLLLSDKIFRLQLIDSMVPTFVAMLFGSLPLRLQIEQAISGAEGLANNLPQASLKAFKIVMPPGGEQSAITRFLKSEIGKLEALRAAAEQSITLLRERRSALITAAVTGQIDVRGSLA